jgi:predicted transcriptional regulator YdeE
MNTEQVLGQEIQLIGITLPYKTTNADGKSMADIAWLWQKWTQDETSKKIQNKISDDVYAVYYNYEGDHTKPYSYFIGCAVSENTSIPEGLTALLIPSGSYTKIVTKGKLPDAVAAAWQEIWQSGLKRNYKTDYEVYLMNSKDWNNMEVNIILS